MKNVEILGLITITTVPSPFFGKAATFRSMLGAGRVKPQTFKIGSDCSFVKRTVFRSENHGSFGYDFKNGGPVSQ
jgi:hypothetical protein